MVGTDLSSGQNASTLNITKKHDQPLDSKLDMATGHDGNHLSAEQPPLPHHDSAQKDVHLREFLSKMDEYAPIVTIHADDSILTSETLTSTPHRYQRQ